VERLSSKVSDREESRVSLRVTTIFRNEDGEWKLLHRHADPITSPRPAEAVVQA
jgi:ketosteroid isomerase-like protein